MVSSGSVAEELNEKGNLDKTKSVEQLQQLEQSSKGLVKGSVFGMYLKSGANVCVLLIIASLFLITQFLASGADYWVSYWTAQEELREYNSAQSRTANLTLVDDPIVDTFSGNQDPTLSTNETVNLLTNGRQDNFLYDLYGLISTQWCINIHGSLMAGLFVFALIRFVYTSDH